MSPEPPTMKRVSDMQLMTQELRKKLPPLCSQEKLGPEAVAHVKYFTPDSQWTWLVTEYDQEDTMFGLVQGLDTELGYFSLSKLQSARGPLGLAIERDLHWAPKPLRECAPEFFASWPSEEGQETTKTAS